MLRHRRAPKREQALSKEVKEFQPQPVTSRPDRRPITIPEHTPPTPPSFMSSKVLRVTQPKLHASAHQHEGLACHHTANSTARTVPGSSRPARLHSSGQRTNTLHALPSQVRRVKALQSAFNTSSRAYIARRTPPRSLSMPPFAVCAQTALDQLEQHRVTRPCKPPLPRLTNPGRCPPPPPVTGFYWRAPCCNRMSLFLIRRRRAVPDRRWACPARPPAGPVCSRCHPRRGLARAPPCSMPIAASRLSLSLHGQPDALKPDSPSTHRDWFLQQSP
jgi:hypothetical protein